MARAGYVYIMASQRNGTLYIGVTSKLAERIRNHREGLVEGFTKTHGCRLLVWFQRFDDIEDARQFERRMKKWNRAWKLRRIEETNPQWHGLYETTLAMV
ncbi:MAG: GIY-YIG nuclease family protein [Sphingomonadales bacterium]|nr:GIY-YIG nuclease family protein [Sphingomonadales bacterium]MDE2570470.1 GIY-YIG nuclease family protein [Sphingomonadales bacterium]